MDPKQPVTATPDIQALKNQLTEKERKIQYLEVYIFDIMRTESRSLLLIDAH